MAISRGVLVSGIGFSQIIAWGSTYYLPAVLAEQITLDTGWPQAWVIAGLSVGLLVAALISPLVGRTINHKGGRTVLSLSAIAIGMGQLGLATSTTLVFYMIAWTLIGLGMGAGLYNAAFATLGRIYGSEARNPITTLTLFGGFASTVCWPISAYLASNIGWRGTCVAYSAIMFFIVLPLYLFVVPQISKGFETVDQTSMQRQMEETPKRPTLLIFATLSFTLTLAAFISSLLSVHLLTILQAGGLSLAASVSLGALVGPSQVAARTIEMAFARFHHPIWTKVASVNCLAIGLFALWGDLTIIPIALVFYGAGIGLESVARGTVPLALFGSSEYATLIGKLAMPSMLAQALAPWIGAILLDWGQANGTLAVVASLAAINMALTLFLVFQISKN